MVVFCGSEIVPLYVDNYSQHRFKFIILISPSFVILHKINVASCHTCPPVRRTLSNKMEYWQTQETTSDREFVMTID